MDARYRHYEKRFVLFENLDAKVYSFLAVLHCYSFIVRQTVYGMSKIKQSIKVFIITRRCNFDPSKPALI